MTHSPQPLHWVASITTRPSRTVSAGQPSFMHIRQSRQASGSTRQRPVYLTYFSSAQGRWAMMREGSSAATSSLTAASMAFTSKGSTTRTRSMPTAFASSSRSTCLVASPRMVLPVVGLSWWPVMPVMELSRMMTVLMPLLYTTSIRPVIPEWMKVESPMTLTSFLANSGPRALAMPRAAPMDAPMQMVVSMALRGGVAPKV